MYYYEVWVRSERYRGRTALTYQSQDPVSLGAVVRVPLQQQEVLGVVSATSGRPKMRQGAQMKFITEVYDLPPLPPELLKLGSWLLGYYRTSVGALGQVLTPPAIPKSLPKTSDTSTTIPVSTSTLPSLTNEQTEAMRLFRQHGSHLLHGRTGSGKTRIYQELAAQELQAGKSVIVLSPEIGLTSQLAESFMQIAPGRVIVLHSSLTPAQRLSLWRRVADSTDPLIIVGARSSLFTPLKQIGLIIIDEFHEPAYKQDQEPRYQAARVAAKLAELHGAALIYGSATPLITDYYMATARKVPIIRLTKLAKSDNVVTNATIVDLRDRSQFSRSPYLSQQLIEAMEASLVRKEQSLLYLNRRGTARLALCQNCGWQADCSHCDLPLTYHADEHVLRCHVCYRSQPVPTSCPTCHFTELIYKSIGTKALVSEVERLFPDATISRFDSDNTRENSLAAQYDNVASGKVDILIGTQTLAKGLDLPKLSTLGIVLADASLALPDYTATERTYQLLQQVLGRVGRGHRNSSAIIQTYAPDNLVIKDALADNWADFYKRELQERKLFMYPPYCQLIVIRCRRASAKSAEKVCQGIKDTIIKYFPGLEVDGPAPALHEKSAAGYTWQLVVKAADRSTLLRLVDSLPKTVTSYDLDPVNLL